VNTVLAVESRQRPGARGRQVIPDRVARLRDNAADRLRKLSELLDMKLISDEEYRVKRSQILKDL